MAQTIQVPGTFENIIDGKLANAEQIYDATEGKSQSAINAKVKEDVEAAEGDISNLQTAVADTYNKSAIDTALSAKQDSISDLATIRSGASAGATAVQPAGMASALADKQDTIADLATIRSGASAGATAVQPAGMASALADKQDTIADLATIRSGASAGATAVQPADMTSALADKQDTIADLATIRSGASAGATAVQPADMTSALADKQDTIADLATIRSGASAGATAVQPADMTSALADKQDTIADLATIRSGASAGATAVQPAALEAEVSRAQAAEMTKANAADVYTKTEVNGMVSTPHQNYVTVADYASLPAVADGQPDTIYRVANYDGAYNSGAGRVDATKYTEYAYSNNALILLSVKSAVGEVFDISEYNSNAIYNSLTEALGPNGANVPADNQRGGMSVNFVKRINYALYNVTVVSNQDSSQVPGWGDSGNIDINEPLIEGNNITAEAIVANLDTTVVADHSEKGDALAAIQALALNGTAKFQYTDTYTPEDQQVGIPVYTLYTVTKTTNEATEYVQYRLMSTAWSTVTSDWQGVDEEPVAGSDNLVKSGGVQNELALGAVYDVSAKNPTAGPNNDGKFESLSALLSDANLNTLIPTAVRKGGMSIKFVQSSDNKYVQYRLAAPYWSTDIHDWTSEDPYFIDKIMKEVNEAINENTPIEIHGDVTNAPDEEDLTSVNVGGTDVLKFKDKAYAPATYSGMGRVYLRKNIVDGVNTLTQDMFYKGEVGSREPNTNTIFVIQYDYTLAEDITVPANCVLEFDGGSISNGTINYNDCTIISDSIRPILINIAELSGNYIKNTTVYPEWFYSDEDDYTYAFRKAIEATKSGTILLTQPRYKIDVYTHRDKYQTDQDGNRIKVGFLVHSNITIDSTCRSVLYTTEAKLYHSLISCNYSVLTENVKIKNICIDQSAECEEQIVSANAEVVYNFPIVLYNTINIIVDNCYIISPSQNPVNINGGGYINITNNELVFKRARLNNNIIYDTSILYITSTRHFVCNNTIRGYDDTTWNMSFGGMESHGHNAHIVNNFFRNVGSCINVVNNANVNINHKQRVIANNSCVKCNHFVSLWAVASESERQDMENIFISNNNIKINKTALRFVYINTTASVIKGVKFCNNYIEQYPMVLTVQDDITTFGIIYNDSRGIVEADVYDNFIKNAAIKIYHAGYYSSDKSQKVYFRGNTIVNPTNLSIEESCEPGNIFTLYSTFFSISVNNPNSYLYVSDNIIDIDIRNLTVYMAEKNSANVVMYDNVYPTAIFNYAKRTLNDIKFANKGDFIVNDHIVDNKKIQTCTAAGSTQTITNATFEVKNGLGLLKCDSLADAGFNSFSTFSVTKNGNSFATSTAAIMAIDYKNNCCIINKNVFTFTSKNIRNETFTGANINSIVIKAPTFSTDYTSVIPSGTFVNKPDSPASGFQYLCTSGASIDGGTTEKTNITITYTGSGWVDSNGTAVVAKT